MAERIELTRGHVHLWYVYTEDAKRQQWLTHYDDLLSSDERARHQKFVFQKDRDQFLIARTLVRTTLSRYSSELPERWRFQKNEFGKPDIKPSGSNNSQTPNRLRFNLSHCDGLVLCGVTVGCEIGVDCENLNRHAEIEKLASRVFSIREQEFFNQMPESMRTKIFFRFWTLKEAYVKARGLGMSVPLQEISFDLAAPDRIGIFLNPEIQDRAEDWQFVQPTLSAPFVAAVAVRLPREEPLSIELHRA